MKKLFCLLMFFFSSMVTVKAFNVTPIISCDKTAITVVGEEISCHIMLNVYSGDISTVSFSLSNDNLTNLKVDSTKGIISMDDGWTVDMDSYTNNSTIKATYSDIADSMEVPFGTIYLKADTIATASININNIVYTSNTKETYTGSLYETISVADTKIANPSTGMFLPVVILTIILFISILCIINVKRINKFYKL